MGLGAAGCGVGATCGGADGAFCLPGTFCKREAGLCNDDAAVGVCTPLADLCTLDFSPVCGCDGVTYGNPCGADAAGVNIDHDGECAEEVCGGIAGLPCDAGEFCKLALGECCCDFQGVCTPVPDACPEIFTPVCGCDGVTYSNTCFADAEGVSVDHEGECIDGG